MKIYLYNPFGGSRGHSQKYSTNIATGLKRERCDNDIYLITSSDFDAKECIDIGVKVIQTKHNSFWRQKSLSFFGNILYGAWIIFSNIRISLPLFRYAFKKGMKTVHMIGGETISNVIILALLPSSRCKKYLTIHNADFNRDLYSDFRLKGFYKILCKYALLIARYRGVHFFTHGEKMRSEFLTQLKIDKPSCSVHKVPVDNVKVESPALPKVNYGEKIRVLFCGVIRIDKGLDILIEALSKLNDKNWILEISGSPSQVGESYVKEITGILNRNIELNLKYLTDYELMSAYLRSHLIVLPYRKSFVAQSVVMTEAVLCNRPVIVSDTSENAVDVVDYSLGWTFMSENSQSLAESLKKSFSEIRGGVFFSNRNEYLKSSARLVLRRKYMRDIAVHNCYIVVNYNTPMHAINLFDSLILLDPDGVFILIENSEEMLSKNLSDYCCKHGIIYFAGGNVGYGRGLNLGLKIIRKINKKLNYVFLMNADLIFHKIPVLESSHVALIPNIFENKKIKPAVFLNFIGRALSVFAARAQLFSCLPMALAFIGIQKVVKLFPSRPYTTHGSLFVIHSACIGDCIFNEKTFLYSEELEFGEYLYRHGIRLRFSSIVFEHEGSASIKHKYKNLNQKLPLFRKSLHEWYLRWFT